MSCLCSFKHFSCILNPVSYTILLYVMHCAIWYHNLTSGKLSFMSLRSLTNAYNFWIPPPPHGYYFLRSIKNSKWVLLLYYVTFKKQRFIVKAFSTHVKTVKASHLVYIVPRWYGSRIYADCQQKLFSSVPDTDGRILLVPFVAEQKRGYEAQI